MLRILIIFFLICSATLSGIYIYLANQKVIPVESHPFFFQTNKRPLVIAHRGGAGISPENTLYAFQHSWKIGADVLETDVCETSDGKLVLLHDETVNRTTDGAGEISKLTLEEVKKLDAADKFSTDNGQTFPLRKKNITIPTLDEVFSALPEAKFNIEIKQPSPTIADSLCGLIREHKMMGKVVVASFSQESLTDFRGKCPDVATSASTSEMTKFLAYQKTGIAESFSPQMSALQTAEKLGFLQIVTKDFVENAHKLNLQVHVWTINNPADMRRLFELGVDGIMTNYPDKLIEIRNNLQKSNQ